MFWLDEQRDLIVYPGQPGALTQYIPEIKPINGHYFCAPNTLHNLQMLAWHNFSVPMPMTDRSYDWPIEPGKTPLPHQKLYANFTVLHKRMFNLGDPGCVDAETEFLSPTGWKRIDQWEGEQVAQYHPNGTASFVEPIEYVVAPCDSMYRLQTTRGVDQKLSADHRVVYLTDKCQKLQITTPKEIAFVHERQAQGWRGKFINVFTGGQEGISLADAELRLMVAVIADGHFPYEKLNSCCISVKKERKKVRLRQLLAAADVDYKEKELEWESKEGYTRFTFQAPRHDKEFCQFYWRANAQQLRIIADECPHWDGSAPIGNRGPTFASTSKQSADFIHYAFVATGRSARISREWSNALSPGIYIVTTRQKHVPLGMGREKTAVSLEPTLDGKKYCFEVPTSMLVLRRNGQVFITGNTMKTLSTLWAMDFLMSRSPERMRALIIAPLTILETVWAAGIYRNFLSRRTFEILTGTSEQRQKKLESDVDIFIINHDGLKVGAHIRRKVDPRRPHQKRIELDGFSATLAARDDIQMVIIDEASAFKDHTTARHACATMIFGKRVPHLKLLTGTPTANAPTDAYGLAKLSNNAFGKSFTGFRMETMLKISEFLWKPQKDGYEKARRLLTPAIRFALEEIWNGPRMTFQSRKVELTIEQKKLLQELKQGLQVKVKSGQAIDAANEAAARQKFLQISMGAIYDEHHNAHIIDAAPRYSELEDIVSSTQRKVVIFVPLTSVVHLVDRRLKQMWKKQGLPWVCDYINGEVKAKDRTKIIQAFANDPTFKAVIADPGAAGHGINEFVEADTVIWFGATDKTELWIQANRRVERPGQKYPSTCFKLVSNKLEESIFDRLETNTSLQGLMLTAIRNGDF